MHENHASIVALHRLKTFFKKSADTFASTQYFGMCNNIQVKTEFFHTIFRNNFQNKIESTLKKKYSKRVIVVIDFQIFPLREVFKLTIISKWHISSLLESQQPLCLLPRCFERHMKRKNIE